MRKTMKALSWLVFLAFIGLSSYANWLHGLTPHARTMLAVVPVGFAASVFILEGLISAGKAGRWTFGAIGFVALASGVASYLGLFGMARDSGVPLVQALLLPLAFDGVVLVASMGIRGFSLSHVSLPQRPSRVRRVPARVPADVPMSQGHVPAEVSHTDVRVPEADVPVSRPRTRAKMSDEDMSLVSKLLSEGVPRRDIAERLGVSRKTIDRLASKQVGG
jgi:Helix-turn-helix domain of resolvase